MKFLGRHLGLLFAFLLALPLCATCVSKVSACAPMTASIENAEQHGCCSVPASDSQDMPVRDPAPCFECKPSITMLAIDSIPPAVVLMPIATDDRVTIVVIEEPRLVEHPAWIFHPPPDTLVTRHTMLTC